MSAYAGFQSLHSDQDDLNAHTFVVQQLLARVGTSMPVKIVAVTNAGEVSPVGFVDVLPLVNQVDGEGKPTPHGTIYHLPYSRMQGGANAIILDPQVGDLGIAVFAHRDISSVKATKKQANPGSNRRHDLADGMYVGGLLNGSPTTYVRFSATGVDIVTPNKVTINSLNCKLDANGNLSVTGEVTRGQGGGDQVTLGQHRHGVGTAATGTVVPTAGT